MDMLTFGLAVSMHIGMQGDYNAIHPHVRFIEDGAIAGAYYNSVENISAYAGWRLEPTDKLGIELALVTGYPAFGPVAPYVRATYDIGNNRIFAAPTGEVIDDETKVGVVVGYEFKF